MKLYFCDEIDDSACFSKKRILEYCIDNELTEIVCFEAIRLRGEGIFYCNLYDECGYTGNSGCGMFCDGYKPLNGKSGKCYHSRYCYSYGDKVILKKTKDETKIRKKRNRS